MTMRSHKFRLFLIITVATLMFYTLISSPGRVVVTEKGEVADLLNRARASLQGKKFWNQQLAAIDTELEDLYSAPARHTEFKRAMADASRDLNSALIELNNLMDEIYKQHPSLPDTRPTPAEKLAQAFRSLAAQIDQAELERRLEIMRLDRIAWLHNVRLLVKVRAQ